MRSATATITTFDRFDFRYADEAGNVLPLLNAETFMVDPVSHHAFVIETTGHTVNGRNRFWVFELPATLSATSLNLAANVSYVTNAPSQATSQPTGGPSLRRVTRWGICGR